MTDEQEGALNTIQVLNQGVKISAVTLSEMAKKGS